MEILIGFVCGRWNEWVVAAERQSAVLLLPGQGPPMLPHLSLNSGSERWDGGSDRDRRADNPPKDLPCSEIDP